MTDEQVLEAAWGGLIGLRARVGMGGRLAHYTTAEAAYKIVQSQQVWLRSAAVMNDFSEVSHGLECLRAAWASPAGQALQMLMDRLRPGLRDKLVGLFDEHAKLLQHSTYLTSLSEHDDNEDELGRLSMWRAYGGRNGVAIVLNPHAFNSDTQAMKVFSQPVMYFSPPKFVYWFNGWVDNILKLEDLLKAIDPTHIHNVIFHAFRIFAMCTKHPAFSEEREWRVFNSPSIEGDSDWVEYGVETISGVPQPLAKLNLFDKPEEGVIGLSPKTLINRVIIGPCESPIQIRAAMYDVMARAGVEDIDSKFWMSLIPLRQ